MIIPSRHVLDAGFESGQGGALILVELARTLQGVVIVEKAGDVGIRNASDLEQRAIGRDLG
jgi:hypothetical protein